MCEQQSNAMNYRPDQQFVEVVIKRLESMLLDEVINLRSKDLLHFYSDSMVQFDVETGYFSKKGNALKPGDVVVDESTGEEIQIDDLVYDSTLSSAELTNGLDYEIYLPDERKPRIFKLAHLDSEADWYTFVERLDVKEERDPVVLQGNFEDLPRAYCAGYGHLDPTAVVINKRGIRQEKSFKTICERVYSLRFKKSHVVVALGCVATVSHGCN